MTPRFLFTLAFGAALPVFAAYCGYFKAHGITDFTRGGVEIDSGTGSLSRRHTWELENGYLPGGTSSQSSTSRSHDLPTSNYFPGAMPGTVAPSVCALKAAVVDTDTIRSYPASPAATTDRVLWALRQIESGSNPNAIGRQGELSAYQFKRSAWLMGCRILRCGRHSIQVHNATITSSHAAAYLSYLKACLASAGVEATAVNIYHSWSLGIQGFRRRGFLSSRCPVVNQDAAQRFANLINL